MVGRGQGQGEELEQRGNSDGRAYMGFISPQQGMCRDLMCRTMARPDAIPSATMSLQLDVSSICLLLAICCSTLLHILQDASETASC